MNRPALKRIVPAKGRLAEDKALEFLQNQGLKLIERNYRCRYGEIDLVMDDGHLLVFVEVRYRGGSRFGTALESVNGRKQTKLLTAAICFLKERKLDKPTRFDVVALAPASDGLSVQWVQDAFRVS